MNIEELYDIEAMFSVDTKNPTQIIDGLLYVFLPNGKRVVVFAYPENIGEC